MKRYFVTHKRPDPLTYQPRGLYHYIDLPAGGHVVVVAEEGSEIPDDWVQLPHLLDSAPAGFNGTHSTLGEDPHPDHEPIGGCTKADSTFKVAKKLAKHVSFFAP